MRVLCLSIVLALGAAVAPADAQAVAQHYTLNIPRQPLDTALKDLAHQTGVQIARMSDNVDGSALVGPLAGQLSAEDALKSLLESSGLTYKVVNERTIAVVKQGAELPLSSADSVGSTAEPSARFAQTGAESESNKGEPQESTAQNEDGLGKLEEIVVTAQKRIERLQDVPVPVTVLSSELLANNNQERFEDYYTRVPGLNVTMVGDGATPQLNMRGITTGGLTSPTVSILIDDIGYGASTFGQGGFDSADLDPADVDHIEVLRGPQGTLYGASAMGGLLKYVTSDPATDRFRAKVHTGVASVRNGDGLGYNVRGSVEGPISDTLALRVSGFKRRDAGYIDSPLWDEEGVNQIDTDGGRLGALWRPSEDFSLKLSAMVQNKTQKGSAAINPSLPDLQRDQLPGSGGFERDTQAYSAIATGKVGGAELTSLSGYSINETNSHIDVSFLGFFTQPLFGTPYLQSNLSYKTDKFSQELRLATPLGQRVEWLVGGFYTHEKTRLFQRVPAIDPTMFPTNPATGEEVDYALGQDQSIQFKEYAAFTDVTFKISDQFDLQVGGRQSHDEVSFGTKTASGPLYPIFGQPFSFTTPSVDDKSNPFTYLAVARYRISPELMTYARFASGYRPGGPNANPELLTPVGLPAQFDADTTRNYELGAKGSLLDRRVSFEAALYYIDWRDIQISALAPISNSAYFVNGNKARSQGIELSMEARPLPGLLVSGWVAWNDAEITEDFTTSGVSMSKGDQLPYSSEYSGSLSVDQEFPLGGSGLTGTVGGVFSYVDDRKTILGPGGALDLPNYTQLDLRAGVSYGSWDFGAFVNNVADKRGALSADPTATQYFYLIRPRTFGLSVSKEF